MGKIVYRRYENLDIDVGEGIDLNTVKLKPMPAPSQEHKPEDKPDNTTGVPRLTGEEEWVVGNGSSEEVRQKHKEWEDSLGKDLRDTYNKVMDSFKQGYRLHNLNLDSQREYNIIQHDKPNRVRFNMSNDNINNNHEDNMTTLEEYMRREQQKKEFMEQTKQALLQKYKEELEELTSHSDWNERELIREGEKIEELREINRKITEHTSKMELTKTDDEKKLAEELLTKYQQEQAILQKSVEYYSYIIIINYTTNLKEQHALKQKISKLEQQD